MRKSEQEYLCNLAVEEFAKRWPYVLLTLCGIVSALLLMIYGGIRLVTG